MSNSNEPRNESYARTLIEQYLHGFEEDRDSAFQDIQEAGVDVISDTATRMLKSTNADERADAAELLMRIDSNGNIDAVIPLLNDESSAVRRQICGILADFGNHKAIKPLEECLLKDRNSNVRHIAAYALGQVGNTQSIPILERVMKEDQGEDYEGRLVSDVAADSIANIMEKIT